MKISQETIYFVRSIEAIAILTGLLVFIFLSYKRDKELYKTKTNLFSQKETKKQIKHQQTLIAKMMKKLKKGK